MYASKPTLPQSPPHTLFLDCLSSIIHLFLHLNTVLIASIMTLQLTLTVPSKSHMHMRPFFFFGFCRVTSRNSMFISERNWISCPRLSQTRTPLSDSPPHTSLLHHGQRKEQRMEPYQCPLSQISHLSEAPEGFQLVRSTTLFVVVVLHQMTSPPPTNKPHHTTSHPHTPPPSSPPSPSSPPPPPSLD